MKHDILNKKTDLYKIEFITQQYIFIDMDKEIAMYLIKNTLLKYKMQAFRKINLRYLISSLFLKKPGRSPPHIILRRSGTKKTSERSLTRSPPSEGESDLRRIIRQVEISRFFFRKREEINRFGKCSVGHYLNLSKPFRPDLDRSNRCRNPVYLRNKKN
jgi:hypothetical protein